MNRAKHILFFLFCFFSSLSFAQRFNFKYYTPKDGLAGSVISNIFQDSKGFIWFAAQGGGISRFDGKEFKNFSKSDGLVSNDVTCFAEDLNGNIWIGTTSEGISKFDGVKFFNYTIKEGLVSNSVYSIYCDKNNKIWFGTEGGGISILYDGKFTKITSENGLSSDSVYSITQDKKGNFWFAVRNGLLMYNGNTIVNYNKLKSTENKNFWTLLCDSKGSIWAGASNGGVVKYNGNTFESVNLPDSISNDYIGGITEDTHGNIWFATEHGALKFDGKHFFLFDESSGLSSKSVFSIITDYEGNIWIGTFFGGVNFFNKESFAYYNEKTGLSSNKIQAIFEATDHTLILGTISRGITLLTDKEIYSLKSIKELQNGNITAVTVDSKNNLWIGTDNTVYVLKKQNSSYSLEKTIKNINHVGLQVIVNILEDKDGGMWLATYGTGVFKLNTDGSVKHFSVETGFPSDNILNMFQDKAGAFWFGTNDAGAVKYDKGRIINFTEKDGLVSKSIWNITEGNNSTIYLGTNDAGIACYDGKTFRTINVKDGLCSNYITSLSWDNYDSTLFVGTDKGINKLRLNPDFTIKSLKFYGEQEGFFGGEVIPNATIIDSKGIIWIGTPNGLFKYNRKFDYINQTPPKLNLSEIRLSYQSVDWKKYSDSVNLKNNIPYHLTLSHRNNHLTFEFRALTTSEVKYSYILEGSSDATWSPLKSTPEADFTNIPAGKTYTFRAKAVNSNGVWSKDEIIFSFTITPPWWQTWWFYTLSVIALAFGVYGFINYRIAQLAKEKKILEEKVIERTLELKSSNSRLSEAIQSITDSMNYAQRIQRSFLTSEKILNQTLKNYFILYKPRDIVSGDFYWSYDLPDRTLIACADSTGHGIPGAFMSLIGISLLNEISHSKGMTTPSEILDELRRIIILALNPDELETGGKDGMDITLISIFKSSTNDEIKIHFAGANNRICMVTEKNGTSELIEYRGDKQPVGYYSNMLPFTMREIIAKKGDIIYMFTDGYADQFGGPQEKKLMTQQLKKSLLEISNLPLAEQRKKMDDTFMSWKGELEQIDDVTLIGINL